MFTGIVEGIGTVARISRGAGGGRSAVRMTVDLGRNGRGLKVGQSVALNGVCLTATGLLKNMCDFEMIDETVKTTDLGNLKRGSIVNVERSLRAGDRLEGHFVLGHIDGTATVKRIQKKPGEVQVWIELPKKLARYVVKKGSIAIDGISLTVTDVRRNVASVCLIPHTVEVTNFRTRRAGDTVNVETDILGKYILGRGRPSTN